MDTINENIPEWWLYITTREEGSKLGWENLPFVDDYGLSIYMVKEYWKKIRSIQKKWWKRLDEEKLLVRLGISLCIVFPIVGAISESFWIGFVFFVIHSLGEVAFRRYMMRCFRKELTNAELPMIENYLKPLWAWEKNKN